MLTGWSDHAYRSAANPAKTDNLLRWCKNVPSVRRCWTISFLQPTMFSLDFASSAFLWHLVGTGRRHGWLSDRWYDSVSLLSLGNQEKEAVYIAAGLEQFNKLSYNWNLDVTFTCYAYGHILCLWLQITFLLGYAYVLRTMEHCIIFFLLKENGRSTAHKKFK